MCSLFFVSDKIISHSIPINYIPPYHAWQGWRYSIGADEELRVVLSVRANYGVWGCKPHVTGAISSLPKASWSSKRRQTSLVIKLTAVTL